MKKCNACGAVIRPDAVFCPLCGTNDLSVVPDIKKHSRFGSLVKAVLCAALFLAVQVAVAFIYMIVEAIRLSVGTDLSADELSELLYESLSQSTVLIGIISNIAVIAIFALYFLIRQRRICHELGLRKFPPVLVPLCIVFGYAMQYVLGFLTAVIPWPSEWFASHSESMATVSDGSLILVIIGTSLVTGFAEEVFFRALVMDRLSRAYGGVTCVIVSAVLFGIAHLSPIATFYATVLGIILGHIYRRFRSVWPCVIVHMAFNLASILGLPDDDLLLYFAVTAVSFGISIITAYLIFTRKRSSEE